MIELIRYLPEHKKDWDNLISCSRNGTFLFYRDYMDYHSDRFIDCSFLILKKGKVEGIIPGNIHNSLFYSHQGLTYGGIVISSKICLNDTINIFDKLNIELKKLGVKGVIYKPVPLIYHNLPSQEDIYALFRNNAEKIGCNISSSIFQQNKLSFNESRKSGLRKSKKGAVIVSESNNLPEFWNILEGNLENKYNKHPVHTLEEIELLKNKFPKNIVLYLARYMRLAVAGVLLYLMKGVVHVQYISANEMGKQVGALDLIFDKLINEIYVDIPVFDFGHSNNNMGYSLNENLIFQKEGFGGRGIVYETYRYGLL